MLGYVFILTHALSHQPWHFHCIRNQGLLRSFSFRRNVRVFKTVRPSSLGPTIPHRLVFKFNRQNVQGSSLFGQSIQFFFPFFHHKIQSLFNSKISWKNKNAQHGVFETIKGRYTVPTLLLRLLRLLRLFRLLCLIRRQFFFTQRLLLP